MTTITQCWHIVSCFGILFLIIPTYSENSHTSSLVEPSYMKYNLWKILENVLPNQYSNEAENHYLETSQENSYEYETSIEGAEEVEEDTEMEELCPKNFDERNMNRNNVFIHNKCKIQTTKVYFHEEGYQYSEEYYYNITCVETDADPFRSNSVEKAEYCYKFHHPNNNEGCSTKYRYVRLFRKKKRSKYWEDTTERLAVGCGCTLGLTYEH